MATAFYAEAASETARLGKLAEYSILDTPPEKAMLTDLTRVGSAVAEKYVSK